MNILIGALFLSIWHSILFWNQRIGISAILFALPVIYITIKLLKDKTEKPKALLISIPILLLSSTYWIYDNPVLYRINKIVIPIMYVMMIIFATSKTPTKSMISKILLMIIEPLNYFGEVCKEVKDQIMKKFNIQKHEREPKSKANIIKAIFFTTVIVLFVIALLVSADNEFADIFMEIIIKIENLSVPLLAIRIGVIILVFFYIASFFINMLSKYNVLNEYDDEKIKPKESLTIYMIITTLNIIYILFCYTQIKSLFTVQNVKYASYARQGFFQLMIVSLINITMILKATSKNLIESPKQQKYKKVMCILMLFFTLIIIISSLTRMTLYQQNYGDTRLRIFVDLTLITEIILLVPTAIYILKGKIDLSKSYFIIIVTMYCIVNFINIDKMIAKNNVNRYIETGKIDLTYLTTKLDSVNTIEELKRLKETEFKYTENTSSYNEREKKKEQLDEYLERKSIELNKDTTLAEFNLSRILAKPIEED